MPTPSEPKIINLYLLLNNTADVSATPTQDVNAFRLQKVDDIRKQMRNERVRTYTKFNKIDRTLSIVETMAECGSIVASPVRFVLEEVAIGLGGAAVVMKYARSKITKKIYKHDEITVLSESKPKSIDNHVSKAIEDGCISQEEFVLISEERVKYSEM